MKTKIIPFDAKMAQDINKGKIKGRIRTKEGDMDVRIISFDKVKLINGDGATEKQLVSLIYNPNAREDVLYVHNDRGEVQSPFSWDRGYNIVLEVPDDEPQFKPFDKVLVRNNDEEIWVPRLYEMYLNGINKHCCQDCLGYLQCIPYEGNEHIAGTTNKPDK